MKRLAIAAAFAVSGGANAGAADPIISGVFDGPITGGIPKFVEIYFPEAVADISNCGFGSANNGGGSDGEEFTFPADSVTADQFIYIASEAVEFANYMGFAPDYTSSAAEVNGDDAIELFCNASVIDTFGDINTDGTGEAWEYLDGWAYRNMGTGPDGNMFVISNWTFSGINATDGCTTNDSCGSNFPQQTFPVELMEFTIE